MELTNRRCLLRIKLIISETKQQAKKELTKLITHTNHYNFFEFGWI